MESDRGNLLRLLAHCVAGVPQLFVRLPQRAAIIYIKLIEAVRRSRAALTLERTDSAGIEPAPCPISPPSVHQLLYYACRLIEKRPGKVGEFMVKEVEEAEHVLESEMITSDILETPLERPLLPKLLAEKAPVLSELFDNEHLIVDAITCILIAASEVDEVRSEWDSEFDLDQGPNREVGIDVTDLITNEVRTEELLRDLTKKHLPDKPSIIDQAMNLVNIPVQRGDESGTDASSNDSTPTKEAQTASAHTFKLDDACSLEGGAPMVEMRMWRTPIPDSEFDVSYASRDEHAQPQASQGGKAAKEESDGRAAQVGGWSRTAADPGDLTKQIEKLKKEVGAMSEELRKARSARVQADYALHRVQGKMKLALAAEKADRAPEQRRQAELQLAALGPKRREADLNIRVLQASVESANCEVTTLEGLQGECGEGCEAALARLNKRLEQAREKQKTAIDNVSEARKQLNDIVARLASLSETLQTSPAAPGNRGAERPTDTEMDEAKQAAEEAVLEVKLLEARLRPKSVLLGELNEERAALTRSLEEQLAGAVGSSGGRERAKGVGKIVAPHEVGMPQSSGGVAAAKSAPSAVTATPVKLRRIATPTEGAKEPVKEKPLLEAARKQAEVESAKARKKTQATAKDDACTAKSSEASTGARTALADLMKPAMRATPSSSAATASPADKHVRGKWDPHTLVELASVPPFVPGFPMALNHTDELQSKALTETQRVTDALAGTNWRAMSGLHYEVALALVCDYLANAQFEDKDLTSKTFGPSGSKARYKRPIKIYCAKLMLEYAIAQGDAPPFFFVDYGFIRNFQASPQGKEVSRRFPALINTVLAKLLLTIDVYIFYNSDESERSNYANLSQLSMTPAGIKKLYSKILTGTLAGLGVAGRELLRAVMLKDETHGSIQELVVRTRQRFVNGGVRMTLAPELETLYAARRQGLAQLPTAVAPKTPIAATGGESTAGGSQSKRKQAPVDEPASKRAALGVKNPRVAEVVTAVHAAYEAGASRVSQRTVDNEALLEAGKLGASQQTQKKAATEVKEPRPPPGAKILMSALGCARAQAAVFEKPHLAYGVEEGDADEVEVLDAAGVAQTLPSIFDDPANSVPWVVLPDGQMENIERTRERVRLGRPLCVAFTDKCKGGAQPKGMGDPKDPATIARFHHKYGFTDAIATSGTLRGIKKKLNAQMSAVCGRQVDVTVVLCRAAEQERRWQLPQCTARDTEGCMPHDYLSGGATALVLERAGHGCDMRFAAVAVFIKSVCSREETVQGLQTIGAYMYHLLPTKEPPWMFDDTTGQICGCEGEQAPDKARALVKQFGCIGIRQAVGDYRFRCQNGTDEQQPQFEDSADDQSREVIKKFIDDMAGKAGRVLQLGAPIAFCNQVLHSQCSIECRLGAYSAGSPISYCQVSIDAAAHVHRSEVEASIGATVRFVYVDESLSQYFQDADRSGTANRERVLSDQKLMFPTLQRQNAQGKLSPDVGISFPLIDGSVIICAFSMLDSAISPSSQRMSGVPTTALLDFGLSHGITAPLHGKDETDGLPEEDEAAAAARVIAHGGIPDAMLQLDDVD